MGVIRILAILLCALPAFGQLGFPNSFFTAALIRPLAAAGTAPDAPTGLSVTADDFWLIGLTPGSPVPGDGIELGTSTDGGAYAVSGGFAGDSFFAAEVPLDTHSYAYRVRATNAFGASAWVGPAYTVQTYIFSYYRMDEAAGNSRVAVVDTTGLGSLTEQGGGTVAQAAGKNTNAASFSIASGHNLESANSAGNTTFTEHHSISFWVYITTLPASSADIIGRDNSDTGIVLDSGGTVSWYPGDAWTPATGSLGSLNAWHLVVATYTEDPTGKLSIDGAAFSSGVQACGSLPGGDAKFSVSKVQLGLLILEGRVDEIAIYNTDLTINDVTVLYSGVQSAGPIFK